MSRQHPRFFQNANFCVKQKNFKFGTKNVLLGYFQAGIKKPTHSAITHLKLTIEILEQGEKYVQS